MKQSKDNVVTYLNRYGDKYTFTKTKIGNILWQGSFDALRVSFNAEDPDVWLFADPSGGPFISIGSDMRQFGLEGIVCGIINRPDGIELVIEKQP